MRESRYTAGPVTSRYLLREFLGLLIPILLAFVLLYLIVDFFDRLDILLKNQATPLAAIRYFFFKVPLIVTQILPPAVLAAMLLSLGMLSRRNEITAFRASGVSLWQTALPLLSAAFVISVAALAWNETVVPYCTRQFQYVNNVEIRKRNQRSVLSDREIWYRGADGFYNIQHVDARQHALFGLTIYQTDPAFELDTIIEVPVAHWTAGHWVAEGATERTMGIDGEVKSHRLASTAPLIHETLGDFLEVQREPEELSYLALRERILALTRKGIDASSYLVDLNLKLAVPFTTFVLACIAIPLAGRVQRHPSLAAIVGIGLATGFGYWVILALTNSLGQSGVLPAVVAAWSANAIYALLGAALFLSAE